MDQVTLAKSNFLIVWGSQPQIVLIFVTLVEELVFYMDLSQESEIQF